MPASDWWFNAGVLLSLALTFLAALLSIWAFVTCAVLTALFIWNGTLPYYSNGENLNE